MSSLTKSDFFDAYFQSLEQRDIQYVILHSYNAYPSRIQSDIDFCVSDTSLMDVVTSLPAFCRKNGWRLIQVIQHEVKAFFCVCVSHTNPAEFLQLDVCSHYMRQGKLLLEDCKILDGARMFKDRNFCVPARQAELSYIFWKAAAKAKSYHSIEPRVLELLAAGQTQNHEEEINELARVLRLDGQYASGAALLADLSKKYQKLPVLTRVGQLSKFLRRLRYPTGCFCILKNEVTAEQCSEALRQLSACAFRRYDRVQKPKLGGYKRIVSSTLLLGSRESGLLLRAANKFLQCEFTPDATDDTGVIKQLHEGLEKRVASQWAPQS